VKWLDALVTTGAGITPVFAKGTVPEKLVGSVQTHGDPVFAWYILPVESST
jgi:hypothetical protein